MDHLTERIKEKTRDLNINHEQVFILDEDGLGKLRSEPALIHIENSVLIRASTYRYPDKAKEVIATMSNSLGKQVSIIAK